MDGDPGLGYAFAVSLVKMGEYDEGVRRLKALEEAKSEFGGTSHALFGSAYADQHEYATAFVEYRKSLAIDPAQQQTHYLAGLALIRNGHPKEAVDELRTALKMSPSDVSAKYHLAFSLVQLHEMDEAQILLQEVIQQDPKRGDAYYELGKLQLEKGDTKGAVSSLETGIKVSPEADYIHYQLAMAYRARLQERRCGDGKSRLYQTSEESPARTWGCSAIELSGGSCRSADCVVLVDASSRVLWAQKATPAAKAPASPLPTAKAQLDHGDLDSAENTLWGVLGPEPYK